MNPVTELNSKITTAGQISVDDVASIAAEGYCVIINNRPDGEGGADQPSSAAVSEAARSAGLKYFYIPMTPATLGPDVVMNFTKALEEEGRIFAHCRSGARSTLLWALSTVSSGEATPEEAIERAAKAGRDLAGARPLLESFAR